MGVLSLVKSVFVEPTPQTDPGDKDILHPEAHPEGGLACTNKRLMEQQREALLEWVGTMSRQLLTGNLNLINTPFPVKIFEPRSYLEKLADVWVYPKYLSDAARTRDPLERMKLVVTWFIAGLHHGFERWKKPFNPILGETWQAKLSDGTTMFMEQISHHPPVSAFHMEGPGGMYRFVGLSQPHVSVMLKVNGFKTVAKGVRYIEFADGSRIDIHYPFYVIKGVVYSSGPRAETEGVARLIDSQNKLEAVIKFGAQKSNKSLLRRSDAVTGEIFSGQTSASGSSSVIVNSDPDILTQGHTSSEDKAGTVDYSDDDSEVFYDCDSEQEAEAAGTSSGRSNSSNTILGALKEQEEQRARQEEQQQRQPPAVVTPENSFIASGGRKGSWIKNAKVVCKLEGSWLAYLDIDNQRVWTLRDSHPDSWTPVQDPLPSDSRYRQDLAMVAQGDLKAAQEWKEKLEHRQRADKKLRNIPGH